MNLVTQRLCECGRPANHGRICNTCNNRRVRARNPEKYRAMMAKARRRWERDNPEKARDTKARWIAKNPEKRREINKRSELKHREKRNEKARLKRLKSPEAARTIQRRSYYNNREKCIEASARWAANNPEKRRENHARWIAKNPEKRREQNRHNGLMYDRRLAARRRQAELHAFTHSLDTILNSKST